MPAKPAIEGGRPVRRRLLPYGHQSIAPADIRAVSESLTSDWITQGPTVERFEKALARACGARHAVAVSNGTTALHTAYIAAGLGPGDAGVTTPLTFSATANAMVHAGGRPRFVDVAPGWPLLDVAALAEADVPGARVVAPVDFAGHPCDLRAVTTLARDRGWTVVEDAAHALGAEYRGKPIGGIADITVFSFHPVKHITTGEGGAVLTNDGGVADAVRTFRHQGIVRAAEGPAWKYDVPTLGHNFRITDFQCALGLSQLRRLRRRVARRRGIARRYGKAFHDLRGLEPPIELPYAKSSYHLYPIRLRLDELTVGRDRVFEALRAEGLGVQVHYIPTHLLSYYRKTFGHAEGDFPNAEAFFAREITLPLFDGMTDDDASDVIEATEKVFRHYAG